jgi:hypothetical protein
VLSTLLACGGEVTGGGSQSSSTAEQSSPSQGGSQPKSTFGAPNTALGDCVEGPLEGSAEATSCTWVAKQHCYEQREMACNCACPRDRDSQCLSGFDKGPTGHVPVDCD